MSEETPDQEPVKADARIEALEARLAAAKAREDERNASKHPRTDANSRMGHRVLAELLGGLLGGGLIGWTMDKLAGSSPWGLLIMLFLGIAVAFRNIIRLANTRPD